MTKLFIDIETFSSVDIKKSGVYPYVEAPDFAVLLVSYSIDYAPVITIDLTEPNYTNNPYWQAFLGFYFDAQVELHAHNANFERICLGKVIAPLPAARWHCTMVKALMAGYPGGLDACAKALDIPFTKLASGTRLINLFSKPCVPSMKNDYCVRIMPQDVPEKWEEYKQYNRQDVLVEMEVDKALSWLEIPPLEREMWLLDQQINDYGILLDQQLVLQAKKVYATFHSQTLQQLKKITGLDNPTALPQLKSWIAHEEGFSPHEKKISITKETVGPLLEQVKTPQVKKAIALQQLLGKTSIAKYDSALAYMGKDGRLRGMFQYYGAGRTGRFAGRGLQPHNLPSKKIKRLDRAIQLLLEEDVEMLDILYDNIPDTLSKLIRSCLIAPAGHTLAPLDFSAIEARVLAWLAGEQWRMDLFRSGAGNIYEASASRMFRVPVETITEDSPYRAKGKVAELALGYQGWIGALIQMGALKMGLKEWELEPIVKAWRLNNKAIVKYWGKVEEMFVNAYMTKRAQTGCGVTMQYIVHGKRMEVELPSGRKLYYQEPRCSKSTDFYTGKVTNTITYWGLDGVSKRWARRDLYGGKITENIVQAVARDLLVDAMLRIGRCNVPIVLHVHDEVVPQLEKHTAQQTLEKVAKIMETPPTWAADLPLKVKYFLSDYYKKD